MAKTKTMPEHEISDSTSLETAEGIIKANQDKTEAEGRESTLKKDLSHRCESLRDKLAEKAEYVGLMRAVTPQGALRCEFRMKNGCLDVSQKATLNDLFGSSRPVLFQKSKVITAVTDPQQLLKDLGDEAFDHLELKVKSGHDEVVLAKSKAVTSHEAYVPQDNFLNNLKDIANTLSDKAKKWMKEYLIHALNPTVVVGTRGASKG
jgi:hypothetical protein